MQPSKGLHNQVVKIVVPYCTVRTIACNEEWKHTIIAATCKIKQMFISMVISIFYKSTWDRNIGARIWTPAASIADGHSSNELFGQLDNNFLEHLHEPPHGSHHEHIWTPLGYRPTSYIVAICWALGSMSGTTYHVRVTTMERLDQGHLHLHPLLEHPE